MIYKDNEEKSILKIMELIESKNHNPIKEWEKENSHFVQEAKNRIKKNKREKTSQLFNSTK